MFPVTGSRMTRAGSPIFAMDWKLGEATMFFQSMRYTFNPMRKVWFGSKTIPNVELGDFSACRLGLPANTPEILVETFVRGSITVLKNVATEGEISGSVGARKPRPQFALKSNSRVGVNLMPSLGVVELP